MKVDYDLIKFFLQTIEKNKQPTVNTLKLFELLNFNQNSNDDCQKVFFYLKLLNDQGLIECISQNNTDRESLGFSFTTNGQVILGVNNFRLTMLGHQTLESMSNSKIWDNIKEPLKKLGIESVKQIPSLAMKFFELHLKTT